MRKHCYKASQQPNADPLAFKCLAEAQLNLGQRQEAEESYLTYLSSTKAKNRLLCFTFY